MHARFGRERAQAVRNERMREGRDTTQAYPANTNRATVTGRSEGSPMCTSDGIVRRLLDLINAGLFKSPGTITYPARVAARRVRVRCDYNAVACVQGNRILLSRMITARGGDLGWRVEAVATLANLSSKHN